MAFKDLRQYVERLEKEGELVCIKKEVDWDLEVGAIIRRSYDIRLYKIDQPWAQLFS